MSIFMVAFRGGIPLGNLAAGFIASRFSAPLVLSINGTLLAVVACVFLMTNPGVRRL